MGRQKLARSERQGAQCRALGLKLQSEPSAASADDSDRVPRAGRSSAAFERGSSRVEPRAGLDNGPDRDLAQPRGLVVRSFTTFVVTAAEATPETTNTTINSSLSAHEELADAPCTWG
ncbi:unnamed protein product [Lampetra planeri]